MNFVQELTPEMKKKWDNELVTWLRKALKGKYGTYIYNVVHSVKQLYDHIERNEPK